MTKKKEEPPGFFMDPQHSVCDDFRFFGRIRSYIRKMNGPNGLPFRTERG